MVEPPLGGLKEVWVYLFGAHPPMRFEEGLNLNSRRRVTQRVCQPVLTLHLVVGFAQVDESCWSLAAAGKYQIRKLHREVTKLSFVHFDFPAACHP